MKHTILCSLLFFFHLIIFAQNDSLYYNPSVEEILKLNTEKDYNAVSISLATKSKTALEETPAVISVITERDIVRNGYRDLADILRMVPGFEFGMDVVALYGLAFRGMWAHEGKALIMINGTTINCFGFGNVNFFGTIPAAMIERVEIIRGPGSALYGGFAEVAVINVITKTTQNQIQTFAGRLGKDWNYGGNISLNLRKNEDTYLSAQIGSQFTTTSNRIFYDFFGGSFPMRAESSWRRWQHLIVEARYKKLSLSYNRNYTNFLAQAAFGTAVPRNPQGLYTNELNHKIETLQLRYDVSTKRNWNWQPLIEISAGNPISSAVSENFLVAIRDDNDSTIFVRVPAYDWQNQYVKAHLYKAENHFSYRDKNTEWNLAAGIHLHTLYSITSQGTVGLQYSTNPADTTDFLMRTQTFALFQYIKNYKNVRLIAGTRYDATPFGNAWSPRLGLIWLQKNLHTKLLYGRAFRVPQLWQIFSRQYFTQEGLSPEITNTIELETGYRFSETLKGLFNAFWIDIDKPITYIGSNNSYQNYGSIGSIGLEAELNWRNPQGNFFINFSYVKPTARTIIDFLDETRTKFLALPPLKINTGASYQFNKVVLATNLTYLSARYAQSAFSAQNSTISEVVFQTTRYQPLALLNLNVIFQKPFNFPISVNLQIHNAFNSKYVLLQPYYGGHAPMPIHDRQFTANISYTF